MPRLMLGAKICKAVALLVRYPNRSTGTSTVTFGELQRVSKPRSCMLDRIALATFRNLNIYAVHLLLAFVPAERVELSTYRVRTGCC